MAWTLEVKSGCAIFVTAVATAEPNSEHVFAADGRHDVVDIGIIRTHHVSALIEGSSVTTVPKWGSYESVDFTHDSPQWPGKQTGPWAEEVTAQAGPSGALYVCFSAAPGRKLDYEVFEGPHTFRMPECPTYAVLARGTATVQGIPLERWQIVEFSPDVISQVTTASPDSIVFYIWDKVSLPA